MPSAVSVRGKTNMRSVVWDIETRSALSLRECGVHIYATDPTTEPLCIVFAIDDEEPQLWLPGGPPPSVFLEIAANPKEWQLIAHNYEFERVILQNILVTRHGFRPIPLEAQHCTQRLALANAYPAELDLLAQALGLPYRKDPAARKAMLAVSRPKAQRKTTAIPTWDEDPAKLRLLYERCKLRRDHHARGVAVGQTEAAVECRAPLPDRGCENQRAGSVATVASSLPPRILPSVNERPSTSSSTN